MVDNFTIILGSDSGEHFPLCLRDTESFERVFYIFWHFIPGLCISCTFRLREIVNTFEVELRKRWSPGRFCEFFIELEGFEAMFEHPVWLFI